MDDFVRRVKAFERSFGARVGDVSAADLQARIADLTAYRDRVLARVRTRCRGLRRACRGYAEDALAEFRATGDRLIGRMSAALPPAAIA